MHIFRIRINVIDFINFLISEFCRDELPLFDDFVRLGVEDEIGREFCQNDIDGLIEMAEKIEKLNYIMDEETNELSELNNADKDNERNEVLSDMARDYMDYSQSVFMLDGKEISKDNVPYVPLSSIKELKFIQGEQPRRIELYTNYVSGFQRDKVAQWPEEYKEKTKAWMFFRVEDAATGRQLKGAEVTIEGTDQKALTNDEGWCELKVPLGATVKASYKGLESQTQTIDHLSGNQVQGRSFLLYEPGHPIYQTYQLSREEEPVFPGDKEKWIAEHIQLPEAMKNKGALGRVIVWFLVNDPRLSGGHRRLCRRGRRCGRCPGGEIRAGYALSPQQRGTALRRRGRNQKSPETRSSARLEGERTYREYPEVADRRRKDHRCRHHRERPDRRTRV